MFVIEYFFGNIGTGLILQNCGGSNFFRKSVRKNTLTRAFNECSSEICTIYESCVFTHLSNALTLKTH